MTKGEKKKTNGPRVTDAEFKAALKTLEEYLGTEDSAPNGVKEALAVINKRAADKEAEVRAKRKLLRSGRAGL